MNRNLMNRYMQHIATKGRVDVGDYIVTQRSNKLGRVVEVVKSKVNEPMPATDYYRVRYIELDEQLREKSYDDKWTTLAVGHFATLDKVVN
jgi:hypothetical protein